MHGAFHRPLKIYILNLDSEISASILNIGGGRDIRALPKRGHPDRNGRQLQLAPLKFWDMAAADKPYTARIRSENPVMVVAVTKYDQSRDSSRRFLNIEMLSIDESIGNVLNSVDFWKK